MKTLYERINMAIEEVIFNYLFKKKEIVTPKIDILPSVNEGVSIP
jgi:hypothetical protein